ncbi:MAG: ABC transporter permease [Burkholderiaceae bacterium]|nr:ABC transporter permease [Burkholderiaceae bacterium]
MNSRAPGESFVASLGSAAWRWLGGWWRIVHFGAQLLVLALSPSSYDRAMRQALARHVYLHTAPILLGFTVICALATLVITRIVVVTALSYGLSQYATEMVVRVLVLELIPLGAALFVALRSTLGGGAALSGLRLSGALQTMRSEGHDPLHREVLPRALAGIFSAVTLAALSCVVALVLTYVAVYGFTTAGLPAYTRIFGRVFSPAVTTIFLLKTFLFSLTVSVIPLASGLYDNWVKGSRTDVELHGLVRMFVVIVLIEIVSLVGNYY